MLKNKLFLGALTTLLLSTGSAFAGVSDTVTVTLTENGAYYGQFVFAGNVENNGDINLSDLTSLSFSDIFGDVPATLANLNAFGTFDTNTDTWQANAADWHGTADAYVTWDNSLYSYNTQNVEGLPYTATQTFNEAVPEPASLALMGLGLIGLLAMTRRRKV